MGSQGSRGHYSPEVRIPNYKNVWADIRRIGRAPEADGLSFKDQAYPQDV